MTLDSCWLPSAIMQTTAALVGIFAVVYVLARDRIGVYGDRLFLAVLGVGLTTIFLNTLWLDSLSAHVFYQKPAYLLGEVAIALFFVLLFVIFLYSYGIVRMLRKEER
jgi:hypothetical protein